MKRLILFILIALSLATQFSVAEQTTSIEQLKTLCLTQREQMLNPNPDSDQQFLAIESCYKQLDTMQINENSSYLHPKIIFKDEHFISHIAFSRSFLLYYLENNIDAYYTSSIPFDVELDKLKEIERNRQRDIHSHSEYSTWIQTQNGLVDSRIALEYAFYTNPSEYQILLISEDKTTPLELKIYEEESEKTTVLHTDDDGIITYQITTEQKDCINLTVSSQSPNACSFIIAVQ